MGARYDQVEPHVGIVRVPLAADITFSAAGEFGPKGVSINGSGKLVLGTGGATGLIGVLVKNVQVLPAGFTGAPITLNNWMGGKANEIVDVMVQGEILDTALAAGSKIYSATNGDLSATVNAGFQVGFTVELGRLFVYPGLG